MRRFIYPALVLLLLLSVSCNPNLNKGLVISDVDSYSNPESNPFTAPAYSGSAQADGSFTFLMLSDTHFGKDGISRSDSAFLSWAEAQKEGRLADLAFMTVLGDLTDDSQSEQYDGFRTFISSFRSRVADIKVFPVIGNHDNRLDGPSYFQELNRDYTGVANCSYYRFDWGDVQFYVLDTSFRTMGNKQRTYFEEALEADDGNPRIVLSHIPLHGSGTIIYASLNDSQEIRQMMVDMKRGGVGAYLSGHEHGGNILYSHEYDDSDGALYEFIASCFFSGTSRKLTARFYLCTYSPEDSSLLIQSYVYDADTDTYSNTPDAEFTLYL